MFCQARNHSGPSLSPCLRELPVALRSVFGIKRIEDTVVTPKARFSVCNTSNWPLRFMILMPEIQHFYDSSGDSKKGSRCSSIS